jgi:tRNA uridine 5-carbamoylmethylation protein Kti12
VNQSTFLIILCGLPSSGKSTFAKILGDHLSVKFSGKNITIIDIDLIRAELFEGTFIPENEIFVRETALLQTQEHLLQKSCVIVDDVNYFNSMRHEFKKVADDLHLPYIILYISTPLETCLMWNKERKTVLDEQVIYTIADKFDIPGEKYYWDTPFESIDMSKDDIKEKIDLITIHLLQLNYQLNQKSTKALYSTQSIKALVEKLTRRFVSFYANLIYNSAGNSYKTPLKQGFSSKFWKVMQNSSENELFMKIQEKFLNNIGKLNTERKKYLEITQFDKFNLLKDYSEKNLLLFLVDFMKYLLK